MRKLRIKFMKRIAFLLIAVAALARVVAFTAPASGNTDEEAPIFGITIPPGYRDWKLISVAHEEGNNNDIRASLGNDTAINAYRKATISTDDIPPNLRPFIEVLLRHCEDPSNDTALICPEAVDENKSNG
jgi:hypothetical protein